MADLQAAAVDAATSAGVDPDFFTSLIANGEKGFNNPGAVSPAGAYAPAGLMPGTAQDLGVDPTDPVQNLQGGARYARQMLDRYNGDQTLAAAAYNAGPGAVDRHGGVPPYPETQAYVNRVMGGLGSGGAPEPSQTALDAAFKASQAGGGGQPPSPSTTSPGGPSAPSGGSDGGSGGYALPPGSLAVNSQHDGSVVDPATGTRYTPDPNAGDGFYRDPQNKPFQIAQPTQDELDSAFKAQGGTAPDPAAIQGPPTSIAGQFARGATDSLVAGANQIESFASPALGMLKQFGDSTDYLGGLIKTGLNGSPPPRLPIAPLMADATGQGFKFNDTSAIDPWLNQRPTNAAQDWARTAGAMAPGALLPGGGGLLPRALMVAGATVGDETGKGVGGLLNASPEATQLLELGGSLLGGGAGHGVGEGGGLIASGARAAADPFLARYSTKAAETQAGRYLASKATDLPAVRASLANGPDVTVPGSTPTTFQQTGDMGLGALERGVATKAPDLFQQRSADQNAARVDALSGMQTGADPMALQSHIRGQLDALDQATQAHIDDLTNTARGKVQAMGGDLTPDAYGEQIRGIVSSAEQAARARESGLWNAVDPNGDLTGNVAATSKAANDIAGSLPSTAKPMQGEEAGIFNAAQNLPAVAPVSDLIALRSRLSTEMRNEVVANGRSPAFARMTQLRSAIQDNLAGTISDAVQADNAKVAAGTKPADQALANKLDALFSDAQSFGPQQARRVAGGQNGVGGGSGSAARGTGAPVRATGTAAGGFGTASGNPGLSSLADRQGALDDINLARRGQTGGLFRHMQELGGVRLRYPDGTQVPGPDVSDALSGNRTPGLVNNQSGLSPEMMAQALHDRGFFGPHETDPSAAFENAVDAHSRGEAQFPTQAYDPGTAQRISQVNREADAAGVLASDRPQVAASKLADYRSAVNDLTSRAISYGINPAHHDSLESLYYQVGDHEASHPPQTTPRDLHGAEFDRLSAPSPIRPTFGREAAGRLATATEATKARAARFGQQPVSSITASSGGAGQYRLPDGRVAGRFFHPGATGYGDVQSLLKASPEAAPVIQDYAASTARRAALRDDGTLDPLKFRNWQNQHADALRALPPETQAKFTTAADASKAIGDAAVQRAATMKSAQAGAVGKLVGAQSREEVSGRIGSVLNSPSRVSDMQTLATATEGDPDARAGLRQAVADHIASKFIGNSEAGASGVGTLKADPFQTFLRQSRPALAKVFSPAEMGSLDAIAADVARSKRSQTALKLPGGSNTAQDLNSPSLPNAHGTLGRVILHTVFDALGVMLGEHVLGPVGGGIAGGTIGTMGGEITNALRMQGIGRVNDLVTRALLDPGVAKAVLDRVPSNARLTPKSGAGQALVRALAVSSMGSLAASRSGDRVPPMLPLAFGVARRPYTPPPMRITPVGRGGGLPRPGLVAPAGGLLPALR